MEPLVLGIDNSLIPIEKSCNEMHKYISTGYSETIIINYPYLNGILDFNCIWLIHAFMLHMYGIWTQQVLVIYSLISINRHQWRIYSGA